MRSRTFSLWLGLSCAACGAHGASEAPVAHDARLSSGSQERACEPIAGVDALLARAPVVLLGEMHGTSEFPAFVAQLACHAERLGPVMVALELPRDMQPALDAFAHEPSEANGKALFAHEMWTKEYQDGRASLAMKALIEELAAQSAHGQKVRLLAIDEPSQPDVRDKAMADQLIAAHHGAPDAHIIVLTGNVHNRLTAGVPWDENYRPMGFELREAGVPVTSLHGTYGAGTAWYCETSEVQSCGVKPLESDKAAGSFSVSLEQPCPGGACDGSFHVGTPSASRPARGGAS